MTMKKATKANFKVATGADGQPTGEVEFYAAKFGNVDLVGDRMVKGSFAATLADWRQKGDPIPIVFSHDWDDPFSLIGAADPNNVVEDDEGLLVKGVLDIEDNPTARQVHRQMARRTLNEASFAYDVIRESGLKKGKDGANDIYEVSLLEVGPTLKGANPDTRGVVSAKARVKSQTKDGPMPGSVEETQNAIIDAAVDYFGTDADGGALVADNDVFYYIVATFDDHAVVAACDMDAAAEGTKYYDFPYQRAGDGSVTLGDPTEVELQTAVVPVDAEDAAEPAAKSAKAEEDPAETLFDLSDKPHATIAVGIVFGPEDERDGTPKPQSEWSYRGTNPGNGFSDAQIARVVARVRAAAAKFNIPLSQSDRSDKSGAKAGARNNSADQRRVQSMHDLAVELGADCTTEKGTEMAGTKDSPSPGVPIGVVETPDAGVTPGLAEDTDDEITVTDAAGNAFTAPRSALTAVNRETEPHEDSDDGDVDGNDAGDDVDTDDDNGREGTAEAGEKSAPDYALDLLELEEFVI